MKKSKTNIPTVVDIPFDETLSRSQTSQIVIELLKSMIFHRNQVPLTIETLYREICEFKQEDPVEEEIVKADDDFHGRRDRIRQRNAKIRKHKLRSKFIKVSEKFLARYEMFEKLVSEVIRDNVVKEVAFTFGMTSGAPKEIYIIHLPDAYGKESGVCLDRRELIRIFRSVMYQFDVLSECSLSSECPLSNMFMAFKMTSRIDPISDHLFPKDFHSWPQRSNVTHFFIKHKIANEPKLPAFVTGTDSYTPSAMQLCTPAVGKHWPRKRYASEDSTMNDQMIETPIQKTNHISRITGDNVEDDQWFYCNLVLKGFRDPQVKRE